MVDEDGISCECCSTYLYAYERGTGNRPLHHCYPVPEHFAMPSLQPYRGTSRKLVLGIDVGTTYSGVAYALLDPGEVPKIHGVTRFPGQEKTASDTKIPSVLYYLPNGNVYAVGAEATRPGIEQDVEDHDLIFVEWFKLHLRPERLHSNEIQTTYMSPLPRDKSVVDVFADFFAYLLSCTRRFICETHANGESLWSSVEDRIEFVISHPNGWEGLQQGKMREAAVIAGLVPNTNAGHKRVHFVTEGEASLNFCIQSGLTTDVLQDGKSVMIVDAGGGTIDISSYAFMSVAPMSVEEVTPADCVVQGSTRVNVRASAFLKERLRMSEYGNDDDIKSMLEYFDASTKPVFKNENEASYIKFGSMKCNDPSCNIKRGQLMLTGSDMVSFFQPSLDAIVDAIQKQRVAASCSLSTVFLVGGFAASPWLYSSLKDKLNDLGLTLYRPDSHTNKAVAQGAVSFYIEHFVTARVMKVTYGADILVDFDDTNAEHRARRHAKVVRPSGRVMLRNGFSTILKQGTRMREKEEVSEPYQQEARETRTLNSVSTEVLCYRGKGESPRWTDLDAELFTPLCTIYADTSQVARQPMTGPNGVYYVQNFNIVLLCGMTELQAQLSWTENGVEKRGPARIVYDDDLEVSR
ncbi:hypothetical protein C8Q76DRAFT_181174 [Earliella scabrosa]|nr:hypothetical protein C8Q76DRAFT_181174 [Earliella scabrosa]